MAAKSILVVDKKNKIKANNRQKSRRIQAHNQREVQPQNARPGGLHKQIIGDGEDELESIERRIEDAGIEKYRRDAVIARHIVLSASPEFFRPGAEGEPGILDKEKTTAWTMAARQFLKDQFGDNCVAAYAHFDETTPHIHATVVPIDDNGRLNNKGMFGPKYLRELQDRYSEYMRPLGISRPDRQIGKWEKPDYQELRKYYSSVREQSDVKAELADVKHELSRMFDTSSQQEAVDALRWYNRASVADQAPAKAWREEKRQKNQEVVLESELDEDDDEEHGLHPS